MKIHIATDHAGLDLKNNIRDYLISKGHEVTDHGAHEYDALDDYPDYIFPCAKADLLLPSFACSRDQYSMSNKSLSLSGANWPTLNAFLIMLIVC